MARGGRRWAIWSRVFCISASPYRQPVCELRSLFRLQLASPIYISILLSSRYNWVGNVILTITWLLLLSHFSRVRLCATP